MFEQEPRAQTLTQMGERPERFEDWLFSFLPKDPLPDSLCQGCTLISLPGTPLQQSKLISWLPLLCHTQLALAQIRFVLRGRVYAQWQQAAGFSTDRLPSPF